MFIIFSKKAKSKSKVVKNNNITHKLINNTKMNRIFEKLT